MTTRLTLTEIADRADTYGRSLGSAEAFRAAMAVIAECVRDAAPASPEAPAPDLTVIEGLVGAFADALDKWWAADLHGEVPISVGGDVDRARAALLSAISRAVSEARAAAELRAEEAERERDEERDEAERFRASAEYRGNLVRVERERREEAESRATALASRVSALEGAISEATDDLTTWLERDVDAFGPSSLRPHPCAPGQVRDRLRAALSAPAPCDCGTGTGVHSPRCAAFDAPAPGDAAPEDGAPPCGECGRTGTHKLDCGNARRARAMPARGDATPTKTPEDRRDD